MPARVVKLKRRWQTESGQVNRIVAEEVECANERNVSHLQILLIETLYYELYYYGHWQTL